MTNIASGKKRSWEEVETEANKRARDRDRRDWRDVHLKSPPSKGETSTPSYDPRGDEKEEGE
jgi:hypothetical protein